MNQDDDVVNDIKSMLQGAESPVSNECCIYKVPFDVRKLNQDAYTPKVVSIGPFHHNLHPHLRNMERHKLIYCKAFLERTKTSFDTWIHYIQEKELDIRQCYSDTLEFTEKELVKMIFVDAGFMFELFWRFYYNDWSETSFLKPWLMTNIRLDLLLLENQIPFFILQGLFNMSSNMPSFLDLTFDYFAFYNRCNLKLCDLRSVNHFTDLLRTFNLQHPLERRPPRTRQLVTHLPSATELSEVGVRFKVNTQSNCLIDLSFSGGVLDTPLLRVVDRTERLFPNMVALEQCHYPYYESYITDYVAVLDLLVNTSRDVDILVRNRVLVHWLGDTGCVANMFNSLLKSNNQVKFNSHYFNLCEDLNAFCSNPWQHLMSTLRRDHCKTPWKTAATIAAIILLFLSLVQSVCTVWQIIKQ